MAYLKLFHGRKEPKQDMEDWGEQGPVFGPFPFFHTTYGSEIKFGEGLYLKIVGDCVYYDGWYYGDWSVFDGPHDHDEFDQSKATLPLDVEWNLPTGETGKFVINEGKTIKGGQNPPIATSARPSPPQGSGGARACVGG